MIDILSAFENKPPELDFIWPGFLAGSVGALVAPGATGKSFLAMQAAISVACGVPGGDLALLSPAKTGKVVYIAGEDPEPALIQRLHALGAHLSGDARRSVAENLHIKTMAGERLNLMAEAQLKALTDESEGARLIVIDTLSRIHDLDENSNSEMAQLITRLERLAYATGAGVLFLHHVSKGSTSNGQADQQQAARGASALIDNARWCGYVAKMTDEEAAKLSDRFDETPIGADRKSFFVRFGVSKQNYAQISPDQWYQRAEGGVLLPINLKPAQKNNKKKGGRDDFTGAN